MIREPAKTASSPLAPLWRVGPGLGLALLVAVLASLAEPLLSRLAAGLIGRPVLVPAVIIALGLGVMLHRLSWNPVIQPGLTFSVKRLLRVAIALLGLRISLGDIAGLGVGTVVIVIGSMVLTILAGFGLARLLGREAAYGALAGCATAVCGASAALATATVLPPGPKRDADTAFTVVAVNALSTVVMVLYPLIGAALGFDDRRMGIFLGASIHDVAQVVGAGYAVSEAAGASAVIVKLFRVLLLLPVVLGIGWWFARSGGEAGKANVPKPVFAVVFLALALLNSTGFVPETAKSVMADLSRWGLLIAIAALGIGTSVTAMLSIGWRHLVIVCGTTLVIASAVLAGLGLFG
jgi:uncharacterized integral membrane protein (TIGR00698 family)